MTDAPLMRAQGLALAVGSALAAIFNLALPRESNDLELIEMIARSDSWPWLHAGLVVAVFLVVFGLHGAVTALGRARPSLASLAGGALVLGAASMLSALVVAGVSLRKAADNFVAAIPQDRAGAFFSALGFDRLAYALFALAAVTLLGLTPLLLGVGLRVRERSLGVAGIIAGLLGVGAGLVELVAEIDTFALYLASSIAVTLWSLALGIAMWRGAPTA